MQGSIKLRQLNENDVDFVFDLCTLENFGYLRRDIKRYVDLEPYGCFLAEIDGKKAGHVFSISYGKLGWIGLLIVHPSFRGKGIGTALTRTAINYLRDKNTKCIKLQAALKAVRLYTRLGFRKEFDSLGFTGKIRTKAFFKPLHLPDNTVKPLVGVDLHRISTFDAQYFGDNRLKVLKFLLKEGRDGCFVAEIKGRLVGYIMSRETQNGYRVGPWICEPNYPEIAEKLFLKCLETFDKNAYVFLGVPAINPLSVNILRRHQFERTSKSIQMFQGGKPRSERVRGVFAIGGPEKG